MSQEIDRKRALSMVLSQTKQQEKKDAEVFTLFQEKMSCILDFLSKEYVMFSVSSFTSHSGPC